MSDITMCSNEKCTIKETCKRHTTSINEFYQSWSNFKIVCNEDNNYDFKIDIELNKKKRIWER